MTGWLPVENAPKNPEGKLYGPYVLVFSSYDHMIWQARWGPNTTGGMGWVNSRGVILDWQRQISHWMPLPPAPLEHSNRGVQPGPGTCDAYHNKPLSG